MILEKWLKNKYIWIIILGILFSFGLAVTVCRPEQAVKQIANNKLVTGGYGWNHIGENPQTIYIRDNKAYIEYDLKKESQHSWMYREFYISELKNSQMIQAEVLFYDGEGNWVSVSQESWGNGYNIVTHPTGTFRKIRIYFYNQENTSFRIHGLRFIDHITSVSKKKILVFSFLFFVCYLLILRFWGRLLPVRTVKNECTECMEELFGWIEKRKIIHFSKYGRIFLWFSLFFGSMSIEYFAQFGNTGCIRYIELGIFVIGLVLAHGYSTFRVKKKRESEAESVFREGMQYLWIFTCLWMMISDFFVEKRCQYVGILLLFAGGYLLYQINTKNCIYEVMTEFELGFIAAGTIAGIIWICLRKAGVWQIAEPSGLHELLIVWKKYLLDMNVLGHKRALFVTGRKILPYNGIWKAGYTYGSVVMLPYILFWVFLIRQSINCYLLRKQKEYMKEFGILLIFLVSVFLNVI